MFIFLQTPTVCLNTVTCSPQYMVSALALSLPSLLCFCLPLLLLMCFCIIYIATFWSNSYSFTLVICVLLQFRLILPGTWITVILSLTHIVVIDFNNVVVLVLPVLLCCDFPLLLHLILHVVLLLCYVFPLIVVIQSYP